MRDAHHAFLMTAGSASGNDRPRAALRTWRNELTNWRQSSGFHKGARVARPRVLSSCDTPPTLGDARPRPIEESERRLDTARGIWLASPAPINARTKSPENEMRDRCLAAFAAAIGLSVRVRVRPGEAGHRHRRPGLSVRSFGHRCAAHRVRPGHQTHLRSRLPQLPRRTRGRRQLFGTHLRRHHRGAASWRREQPVVVDCAPGGSMYRYFTGDAVTESTLVFRWMVVYNAHAEPLAPCLHDSRSRCSSPPPRSR